MAIYGHVAPTCIFQANQRKAVVVAAPEMELYYRVILCVFDYSSKQLWSGDNGTINQEQTAEISHIQFDTLTWWQLARCCFACF